MKEFFVFIVNILLFVLLLAAVAKIPQSSIEDNFSKSAELLCDRPMFEEKIKGISGSKIDRFADSVLLGIAWQYDSKHPFKSVMKSAYFRGYYNANINLKDAVADHIPANQEYLRYWHGSISVIRLLLLIMPLRGIYIFNSICIIILTIVLIYKLIKIGGIMPATGLIAGYIATSAWFVPLSLEYTWTFILMLVFSLVILRLSSLKKGIWFYAAFLSFGMITNYFDFLTTETLTLTVPLLILLWTVRQNQVDSDQKHNPFKVISVKASIFWILGYAGTWVMKWLLAALILKENVIPYVNGHVTERLVGQKGVDTGTFGFITGALVRNIKCLLPFEYGITGTVIGIMILLFLFFILIKYRSKSPDIKYVLWILLVSLIPYIRYLLILNHSYLHYFFTYRAQLAVVLSLALISGEILGIGKRKDLDDSKK